MLGTVYTWHSTKWPTFSGTFVFAFLFELSTHEYPKSRRARCCRCASDKRHGDNSKSVEEASPLWGSADGIESLEDTLYGNERRVFHPRSVAFPNDGVKKGERQRSPRCVG